jgi:alkylation response protein AidB-like acyl-CoA dehydrogenase
VPGATAVSRPSLWLLCLPGAPIPRLVVARAREQFGSSPRQDGDDVIIDGEKLFITNGAVADLYLVFGKWADIADARDSLTAVVAERATRSMRRSRRCSSMAAPDTRVGYAWSGSSGMRS